MLDSGALSGGVILQAQVDQAKVNPSSFLELGVSYLHVFKYMVGEQQVRIDLGGWRSVPGKPSIGFGVSDEAQARGVIDEIGHEIGHSAAKVFRELADIIARTQDDVPVVVGLEKTDWRVGLHAVPRPRPEFLTELTERRVYIDKAGGSPAMVRIFDLETKHHLTMRATDDVAQKAASFLYRDVDARVLLRMRADNFQPVSGGELLDVSLVSDEPLTYEAMKAWWNGRYAGRA